MSKTSLWKAMGAEDECHYCESDLMIIALEHIVHRIHDIEKKVGKLHPEGKVILV